MKDKGVNKKLVLILLSIAHICFFVIFLIWYFTTTRVIVYDEATASNVSEETVEYSEVETQVQTELETETQIETETETETQTETENETETETETQVETQESKPFVGNFTVVTENYKLNIRQEPTVNSAIVGKMPKGMTGKVIEIVNDDWALIEYDDMQGYCSMEYLVIEFLN